MLDLINQKIIFELKKNSRISWGELSRVAGISRQALRKRIERLEYKRYIIGYTIVTSHEPPRETLSVQDFETASVQAFLKIKFSKENNCFKLSRTLLSYDSVIASWSIAGYWDNIVLVRVNNIEEISKIREIIIEAGGIDEIKTDAILNEWHLTQQK